MAPATEYRLIQGTTTGERWVLHPRSLTCDGPLPSEAAGRYLAGHPMSDSACELDADPAMLDGQQYRTLLVQGEPTTIVRAAIERSGLSARRWAEQVALRDERTVRRWLAGDSPIPEVVLRELARRG